MISIGRQYGVRSPLVAQYHPIRGKKVFPFNKIMRYCIMSPSRWIGSRFEPLTQLQHRAAEPHIRSPLRAADTKIPRTRGHRAREDGTNLYGGILQPGRYAAHPPRSDEGFPSWILWRSFGLRPHYAAFST